MTQRKRITLFLLIDSFIVFFSFVSALLICGITIQELHIENSEILLASLIITHLIFAILQKLYFKAWEYASIGEVTTIIKTESFTVMAASVVYLIIFHSLDLRLMIMIWMALILFIGGSRFVWRAFHNSFSNRKENLKNTLVIGAGVAGTMVVRQLLHNNGETDLNPVAFVDDDYSKQKLHILGIPVVGTSKEILEIVKIYKIEHIVVAIPSATKKQLKHIHQECARTGIKTQTIPMIEDLMSGKVATNHFKDVEVEDLLGRESIILNAESISEYVSNKTILVTGAGGSIGSEICRQICKFNPEKIVLLGHGENSIYSIDMELKNKYQETIEIIPIIADIQDRERIFEVMNQFKPSVIYHAAAHKHVPLMEFNPREAVKNNVIGTKNVADAADVCGVNTFVLISSDKAVNPPNIMGATKRIAEMIIQQLNVKSRTNFVAVRFGNVLGSRGSVIPLFKKQIQDGGPVTVTHPDMMRYFMTIPEASGLVIQAGALAKGGEIFVLNMGEPVKIVDLAKNMIQLSGHDIDEIGIKYTGVRPGEKLFEELFNAEETQPIQVHPKIFIGDIKVDRADSLDHLISHVHELSVNEIKEYILNLANKKHIQEEPLVASAN